MSDVYKQALDLLRESGWSRASRETPDGKHCIVGAIEKVKFGDCVICDPSHAEEHHHRSPYTQPEVTALEAILQEHFPSWVGKHRYTAEMFNDSERTQFHDVEKLLVLASEAVGSADVS